MLRASISMKSDGISRIFSLSRSMSRSFHSPITSAFSSKKNAGRGSCIESVRSACTMSRRTAPEFHSPKSPEGTSMETM